MIDWIRIIGRPRQDTICTMTTSQFYAQHTLCKFKAFSFSGLSAIDHTGIRVLTFAIHNDGRVMFEASAYAHDPRLLTLFKQAIDDDNMHVTRIDYAFDFAYDGNIALELFHSGPSGKTTYIESTGATLYIGKRRNNTFVRLYDKGAEQGGTANQLWRAEVELKGKRAQQTILPDDQHGAYIHDIFSRRGIQLPYDPTIDVTIEKKQLPVPDTFTWLSRVVRPAVTNLVECGEDTELLQAIIFQDVDGEPEKRGNKRRIENG